jgi:hypothetical protein
MQLSWARDGNIRGIINNREFQTLIKWTHCKWHTMTMSQNEERDRAFLARSYANGARCDRTKEGTGHFSHDHMQMAHDATERRKGPGISRTIISKWRTMRQNERRDRAFLAWSYANGARCDRTKEGTGHFLHDHNEFPHTNINAFLTKLKWNLQKG